MQIRRTTSFIVLSLIAAFLFAACGGGSDGGNSAVPVPEVTTAGASSINVDNAVLNGSVNPNGLATTYWFEFGTSSVLTGSDNTASKSAGSGTAAVAASNSITGLSQGTTYYFRLAASNSAGTTKGAILSLTTASPMNPPTVQTNAPDNLSVSGATLHASVNPNGLLTSAHFEWGTDNTFAVPNVTTTQSVGSDTTSHQINAVLTGLDTGTKYYCRVVANNSAGTSKGLPANFTTNTLAPTVANVAANPVGSDNAVLRGTVNPNGQPTTYHFEWGTSPVLTGADNTPTLSAGSATGDVAVNATILGLLDNTTYYYRVVATNATDTSKGTPIRFFNTTLKSAPIANAHYNESVYSMGPGTSIFAPSATVVTLEGWDSSGSYPLVSYDWTQIAGTNTVTPDDPSAQNTTATVPTLKYGVTDNIVFQLTVTDSKGQSSTDTISKYVKWGYLDDFHINSIPAYEVFDTGSTGTGIFTYDTGGQRAQVVAGANTGLKFQKTFTTATKTITSTGTFSFDFTPTSQAGTGGSLDVRLNDGSAYLELSTSDGEVRKVWPLQPVDSAPFVFPYLQGITYHITISFSDVETTFLATGGGLTVGPVILNTNTNTLAPVYLEINSYQQTSFFDNIKLEAKP